MLFSIFNLIFTALEFPCSPRSDNLNVRSVSLDSKFKTNLIVTLACTAVTNCVSTFGFCNFNESFCNDRTGKRCAEEVLALVNSTCFYCGNDIFVNKFLVEVFNVKF